MAPATNKCSFRSCKKICQGADPEVSAFKCSAPGCEKLIHLACCKAIANHHNFAVPKDCNSLFCTKACKDKLLKAATGTKVVLWSQDGSEGPNDKIGNSERLLIDWIITGDNYANYCGPKNGDSKHGIAFRLSEMFKEKGVRVERSPKSIEAKISQIEQSFKKAFEWTQQTGVGVKEDDPEGFEQAVVKRCAYFHDLEKVMGCRSKVKPLCTSDNLLGPLSDSSDDEDNSDNECISISGGETTTVTSGTTGDSSSDGQRPNNKLSLVKKRAFGAKKSNTKKKPRTDFGWDDSQLASIVEMKQRELEMKQKDQLIAEQGAQQDLKMKTIEHIQKLKSPPFNWSDDKIKRVLGPTCEPILEVFTM